MPQESRDVPEQHGYLLSRHCDAHFFIAIPGQDLVQSRLLDVIHLAGLRLRLLDFSGHVEVLGVQVVGAKLDALVPEQRGSEAVLLWHAQHASHDALLRRHGRSPRQQRVEGHGVVHRLPQVRVKILGLVIRDEGRLGGARRRLGQLAAAGGSADVNRLVRMRRNLRRGLELLLLLLPASDQRVHDLVQAASVQLPDQDAALGDSARGARDDDVDQANRFHLHGRRLELEDEPRGCVVLHRAGVHRVRADRVQSLEHRVGHFILRLQRLDQEGNDRREGAVARRSADLREPSGIDLVRRRLPRPKADVFQRRAPGRHSRDVAPRGHGFLPGELGLRAAFRGRARRT
eukprot:scaffold7895_cov229-Pinguiococcus_pyrenoidosus.AAC.4